MCLVVLGIGQRKVLDTASNDSAIFRFQAIAKIGYLTEILFCDIDCDRYSPFALPGTVTVLARFAYCASGSCPRSLKPSVRGLRKIFIANAIIIHDRLVDHRGPYNRDTKCLVARVGESVHWC